MPYVRENSILLVEIHWRINKGDSMKPTPITLAFPSGGLNKSEGFVLQEEGSTPSCSNVWPRQYPGGRRRGGVRPGLTAVPAPTGIPYNWTKASWIGGQGVAVTTSAGTYLLDSPGGDWIHKIVDAPVSNFSSCAVYQRKLYQADSGSSVVRWVETEGSTGGNLTATGLGSVPTKCGLVAVHGDRLVLSGDADDPQLVYMSHIGNATDWDYTKEERSAAWVNSGGTEGHIGENVTSLISHNKSCLLIGCTDSLYVIRGNPTAGNGEIANLSHVVGPLMQSAWCKTASEYTVMLTRQGLYAMAPGCGDTMENISDRYLPDDLVGLDPVNGDYVSLVYDSRFRGVHIYVSRNTGERSHFFFDTSKGGGFWPMTSVLGDPRLGISYKRATSLTKSDIHILGDNEAWQYDTESREPIDSHCFYGPISIGSPHTEGIFSEVSSVLSHDSSEVNWDVYAGDSPQEAFYGQPKYSGRTWSVKGLNHRQHPRVRGVAGYIKAWGTGSSRWSIEEIVGTTYARSRRRID